MDQDGRSETLYERLEEYCLPLDKKDEEDIDIEVLERTMVSLPERYGFTYAELEQRTKHLRAHDRYNFSTPIWLWLAVLGHSVTEGEENRDELDKRLFFFTRVYGDELLKLQHERRLVYGSWIIAPYYVAGDRGPRLYRFKNYEDTPPEILKYFGFSKGEKFSSQTLDVGLLKGRHPQYVFAFSQMPAQAIDRAARGTRGWAFPVGDAPVFEDINSNHAVTYFADGLTLEALRDGVMQLNPRTADVWRLCTATILESWGEGEKEPPRVWIDARQLCDAMGFKKHHNGGHRQENIAVATRALVDLERFYITIPYGAKQYPIDANGRRKVVPLEARARHRVLAVMGKEEVRQIFDDEWLPLRWLVTAGDWIKAYPREQFAPLFRALVELPGSYATALWAKSLGTELIWQYRQDRGKTKTQRVETMLRQACVLAESHEERNKKRVRDNFEKALDVLHVSGVCAAWEYKGSDIDEVETTKKGWFDLWLQTRVIVYPPPEITKALETVATKKKRKQKRF